MNSTAEIDRDSVYATRALIEKVTSRYDLVAAILRCDPVWQPREVMTELHAEQT